MSDSKTRASWPSTFRAFCHPRVITLFFFGITAGIPLLLIFSSLSLWLREAGVERAAVTYFSWAALGYSFKFVWAPVVDKLPLPLLTAWLGRRRSWLIFSQLMVISAITMMALINPIGDNLTAMAFAAVFLGFSAATQDIIIDAYRIESAGRELQALMSSSYIAGYRIGMLIAGAGVLFLASYFGSEIGQYNFLAWQLSYLFMAALMLTGVITTLIIAEPATQYKEFLTHERHEHFNFLILFILVITSFIACFYITSEPAETLKKNVTLFFANPYIASFLIELFRLLCALIVTTILAKLLIASGLVSKKLAEQAYIEPIKSFFQQYGYSLAWLLLILVGTYRISDIVLGVISNVFYQDLGFSKIEIASVVKSFGLLMTLVGGFLGGALVLRYGVLRILFIGALLSALTNLLFMLLAKVGHDMTLLYFVISADNLSAGLASAAFIAFLSSLTNISFTAVQYAIFSSLMTLLPKALGGYSGSIVETLGYQQFFLITALMGLPVLFLITWTSKRFQLNKTTLPNK